MTTTWRPHHRRPSALACQVAPIAAHLAQPAPSATTAQHHPQAVLVSATESHAPVTESSLTVAARDAGIATTLALVVLLEKKSTYPAARDATAWWSDDDEYFCFQWKKLRGRKKRQHTTPSIRYGDLPVCKIHTFTASIQTARQAGFSGALHEAESAAAFRCICFRQIIHVF